ncbi:2,3-diphosphoglycerate-dependent phosphoglycerate mutase [Candidatus Falkowbacteria bacterium HGW-Falkowbacteria-2]|uniref:2,3-bisphosphoglycerate-dependent phosphoglycerate mutase n=1 Tax=Candidatus Falkowbacteria bacterium HGW-Falkowbacteria-2 TaxID=2013769 RepID=A0A2N2DZZ1_9BACT|nr:MAG: 2,3-diphosphoglycerate-dependent phosphoglycerate mutase [Candidatus Falkowbacteria bacterium HGW-Falkowbacteria-2]
MYKLVLLRHGESVWNEKGLFTGWTDVDLSENGLIEAKNAGKKLKKAGFYFDAAYSSYLKRALKTLDIVLEEMEQLWLPVAKDWRLNERHYGNLQGLNKKQMAKKFGEEQVKIWRRGYDVRPPKIDAKNKFNQKGDPRYHGIKVPEGESLKDVVARVAPIWEGEISRYVKEGHQLLIAASGNSLRALVKLIEDMPEEEIVEFNIPTAIPLVYEFDKKMRPTHRYYLASKKELQAATAKVTNQGKIKK